MQTDAFYVKAFHYLFKNNLQKIFNHLFNFKKNSTNKLNVKF